MGGDRAAFAQQAKRGSAGRRPAGAERHLLAHPGRGAPWRDLPERYGPYTTVYNRYNRWRKAGVWDCLLDALVEAGHNDVRMIDTSTVRVHLHAGCAQKGDLATVSWDVPEGA